MSKLSKHVWSTLLELMNCQKMSEIKVVTLDAVTAFTGISWTWLTRTFSSVLLEHLLARNVTTIPASVGDKNRIAQIFEQRKVLEICENQTVWKVVVQLHLREFELNLIIFIWQLTLRSQTKYALFRGFLCKVALFSRKDDKTAKN